MRSQSTCDRGLDCYCKTRVPIARQRRESSERRGVIPSAKSFTSNKAETNRIANKIPLVPAKFVDEEKLDSKGSSDTLPVSPALSPETSAALEHTEELIKDAEIRIKEISRICDIGCLRNFANQWPNETSLDDENDQLLYVRERVASKFEEANGWIDEKSKSSKLFEQKIRRKSIDFSEPKFQTFEERYREFLQKRKLPGEEVGFSVAIVDDATTAKSNSKTKESGSRRTKNCKIDACSVQMGPAVDIRAELVTRNLKSIHISPDTSFQTTNNVRIYQVNQVFSDKRASKRSESTDVSPKEIPSKEDILQEGSGSVREVAMNEEDNKLLVRKDEQDVHLDLRKETKVEKEVRFKEHVSLENKENGKEESKGETLLSSVDEIETRRLTNKRRRDEIRGKAKSDNKKHYEVIDQRFSDLLNKYCTEQTTVVDRFIEEDSSERSDDLVVARFYEPSINRLDNLLTAYDRILNNAVLSTKTIDAFLSRLEFARESSKIANETTKSIHLRQPQSRTNQPIQIVSSKRQLRSSFREKKTNKHVERRGGKLSTKGEDPWRKPFTLPKRSTEFHERRNEESTESSKRVERIVSLSPTVDDDRDSSCSFNKLFIEKLPSFQKLGNGSFAVDTCSTFSRESSNLVNEGMPLEALKLTSANFRDTIVSEEIPLETNNIEHSIVRVLREETRFIEQTVKSVFNVDEIVPLLAKSLLQNLQSNVSITFPNPLQNSLPNLTDRHPPSMSIQYFTDQQKNNFCLTEKVTKDNCSATREIGTILQETDQDRQISSKPFTENAKSEEIDLKNNIARGYETLNSPKNCKDIVEEENLCESLFEDLPKPIQVIDIEDTVQTRSTLSPNEHSVKPVENFEARDDRISSSSSSDSLHDCPSLHSSSNVVSKLVSSKVQPSGHVVNEIEQISGINDRNVNQLCSRPLEKDQILSELYQDVHQRFFSSTFNTNYSCALNPNSRLSNSVSAIQSKTGTSSSSTRSEGELHIPSSGSGSTSTSTSTSTSDSYSVGEVRMLMNNRSDGENCTDSDITAFLTEQMLVSWNESSKALVQSIGEI